jgi:pimeloyl-ACP methyl ester carboxylesterase
MRRWGNDPALGKKLIDALADCHLVIAADYEGHVLANPKPDTLTPANLAADLLAIADAAGAERFTYYGYSWLAVAGLQLALRTDRLTGLAMGGFPPLNGPYQDMLAVTRATHDMAANRQAKTPTRQPAEPSSTADFDWDAAEITMTEPETRQFVTLYTALQDFDDRAAQRYLTCRRLCFAGTADRIEYGPRWNNITVDIAGPVIANRAELEALGWRVHLLDGLGHTQAMQPPNVIPILMSWLDSTTDDA